MLCALLKIEYLPYFLNNFLMVQDMEKIQTDSNSRGLALYAFLQKWHNKKFKYVHC